MSREIRLALVQAASVDSVAEFDRQLGDVTTAHPAAELFIFPEFHTVAALDPARLAQPLDGPLTRAFADLARKHRIWLIPGTFFERDTTGNVFNTVTVFSPDGELVASYRKVFPWRPVESSTPGDRFVVFPIKGAVAGLLICYDAWFPEASRQLAWMGAELLINVVMTPTEDRAQEIVLARSNAIVNQVFLANVNAAAPRALGRSLMVDPQGRVIGGTDGAEPVVIEAAIDLDDVRRTRRDGTEGVTRPWDQFRDGDAPIALPVYGGAIQPSAWRPPAPGRIRSY